MPLLRCQPRPFTFYFYMAENPLLSVGDIAKETGLSRQRVWQLAVIGGIPAKRANPGGKHYRFHDSAKFAAWRKEKKRQSARARGGQVRRDHRISRRREEKINKLFDILTIDETGVSAEEKQLALQYFNCLRALWRLRWSNPSKRQMPVLEGLHALYESKSFFWGTKLYNANAIRVPRDLEGGPEAILKDYELLIKDLPTRPETTQQNGQSSLNA
jgi:hypothetical protein